VTFACCFCRKQENPLQELSHCKTQAKAQETAESGGNRDEFGRRRRREARVSIHVYPGANVRNKITRRQL